MKCNIVFLMRFCSNATCIVSNAYDHQSRRVRKITPATTHTYLYDGWNLLRETIDNQQSAITNRYIWGKDLSGTLQAAGRVGGLVAVQIDHVWDFPVYDNNGNIVAYTDEYGTIVAEYTYDAFGRTIMKSGTLASVFTYRFSTKYYDPETDLYYYGYRFFSPQLFRCIKRDPLQEGGGFKIIKTIGNEHAGSKEY